MDATEILTAICMHLMGPALSVPLIVSCMQRQMAMTRGVSAWQDMCCKAVGLGMEGGPSSQC